MHGDDSELTEGDENAHEVVTEVVAVVQVDEKVDAAEVVVTVDEWTEVQAARKSDGGRRTADFGMYSNWRTAII